MEGAYQFTNTLVNNYWVVTVTIVDPFMSENLAEEV